MSYQAGYFTPDEHYEALLNRLVEPGTRWLDVGCGRELLPSNPKLAAVVAGRCSEVVGVDPDDNVLENTLLHRRVKGAIEDFPDTDAFDLITLRMVAEHITRPEVVVKHLARLCRPGGVVLVYTVDAWAPPLGSGVADAVPVAPSHQEVIVGDGGSGHLSRRLSDE